MMPVQMMVTFIFKRPSSQSVKISSPCMEPSEDSPTMVRMVPMVKAIAMRMEVDFGFMWYSLIVRGVDDHLREFQSSFI